MASKARRAGSSSLVAPAKISDCQASPPVGHLGAAGCRELGQEAPLLRRQGTRRIRQRVPLHGQPRRLRRVAIEPGARRRDPLVEDRPLVLGQRTPLLGLDPGRHVDARDLEQQRQVGEGGAERGRLGRDVGRRVQQGVAERGLEPRRQLALDLAARGRGGEPVELVEQARDRVRPVRVELDRLVRARTQEQEAQLLGRDHLGDRMRGGAAALRRRHLAPADVEELVRAR